MVRSGISDRVQWMWRVCERHQRVLYPGRLDQREEPSHEHPRYPSRDSPSDLYAEQLNWILEPGGSKCSYESERQVPEGQ